MNIRKILSFFVSMPFFGVLLFIMAGSMALATFIESAQGTNTAWAVVYDSWWFELGFFLVLVNLIGIIVKFRLYKRAKWPVLVYHLAFIVIIIGGGITRFTGTEGMMHIREGGMSASIISSKSYLDVTIKEGEQEYAVSKKVRLSAATPRKFRWSENVNGTKVQVKSTDYIQNAAIQYVASPGGKPYLQMIVVAGRQMTTGLASGEVKHYPGLSISFNNLDAEAGLKIFGSEKNLLALSSYPVSVRSMGAMGGMGDDAGIVYQTGDTIPFEEATLYDVNGVKMAIQRYMASAQVRYVKSGESVQGSGLDVVRLEVAVDGMKSELYLQGHQSLEGEARSLQLGDMNISAKFGAHRIQVPFVLRLEDFRIDRYPGSHSPSSFESDVTLIDPENDVNELRNIYMNNVLKYQGYRFYQSSYDQDELGTILSVNKDYTGTVVSYLGYLLLAIGMLLSLTSKSTRFAFISRATAQGKAKTILILAFLSVASIVGAQSYPAPSKQDAAEFGTMWVQGKEGRFKPMNTLSSEVMRKLTKKSRFQGLNADQAVLGMIAYPDEWKNVPLFEVDNPELHKLLGYKGTEVCFNDFINSEGYILSQLVNEAYNKPVNMRNDLDKEVMKLDEKINVFYMTQNGALLKIFPDPNAPDHKWHAVSEVLEEGAFKNDSLGQVFLLYTHSLREGDAQLSSQLVDLLKKYQLKNSTHELSEFKMKAEIFYNKVNIFIRLIRFYLAFGFMLLIMQFISIFNPKKWVRTVIKIDLIHLFGLWIIHVVFFGLRWYVSGHAPLSNGYESMLFVSMITLLAGLIFSKRTTFAPALTAILAALSLLVAHMSWMNPDITNLVPVLKSPWLTIHVMVIMSGYGFTGLSWLLGLINLVFFAIVNKGNKEKIAPVIPHLTRVNQLAVMLGLYFLTIGTFLGGIWANESWGRYWGWDPKETWALISVLVYAFLAHMHHFPGLKGSYAFNLGTTLGYFSIIMTYFGVNYFLGGIHSYAGGAAFDIPIWVYISIVALFALSFIANTKNQKFNLEKSTKI